MLTRGKSGARPQVHYVDEVPISEAQEKETPTPKIAKRFTRQQVHDALKSVNVSNDIEDFTLPQDVIPTVPVQIPYVGKGKGKGKTSKKSKKTKGGSKPVMASPLLLWRLKFKKEGVSQ